MLLQKIHMLREIQYKYAVSLPSSEPMNLKSDMGVRVTHIEQADHYRNAMEAMVVEAFNQQLRQLPPSVAVHICKSEVVAYALNRLPPLYATCEHGWHHQWLRGEQALVSEITQVVRQALAAIQQDPLRVSTPLQRQSSDRSESVLQELREILLRGDLTWETVTEAVVQAMTTIEPVIEVTDELVAAFRRLIPQLSSTYQAPSHEELSEIVAAPSTLVLSARHLNQEIVGLLTLVISQTPTGMRAWIEDLSIDSGARGKGVGEALCQVACQQALARGAKRIEFGSSAAHPVANRLCQKMGFVKESTHVYRHNLDIDTP